MRIFLKLYMNCLSQISLILLLLLSTQVWAECAGTDEDCIAIGQWQFSLGVGAGGRTNPLVDGDDIPIFLLPQISYYGERFFWDTATLGFTLLETKTQILNAVATVGFDQMYFNDWSLGNFVIEGGSFGFAANFGENPPIFEDQDNYEDGFGNVVITPTPDDVDSGPNEFFLKSRAAIGQNVKTVVPNEITVNSDDIKSRKMAGLAGIEYTAFVGKVAISLQLLQDFTGIHEGREVRFGVDYNFTKGRNAFDFAAGAVWQDQAIVDYYYGVDLDEIHQPSLVYTPSDSITPYIRLDWSRPIAKRWTLQATLHQKWFDDTVVNSPLVDKDSSISAFIGGVYHF